MSISIPPRRRVAFRFPLRHGAATKIVLWILVGLFSAGAIGVLAYTVVTMASDHMEEEARKAFADNPVILEHIGEWEECTTNLQKTGNYERTRHVHVVVFDLKGTKGSGVLVVTEMDNQGNYESAALETDHGTFELQ
ncbi:hypothetical protein LOC68_28090 [Blastopirellula sp. JC732]|uniref:Cytochrome oxidase complex assembly protein 1 n=1 Tax=Blastopirellula sediminis TaxID=2894196 RepID=A0A9X1MUE0_9BACT|nr:hypothetical protein [Blastopirellula sediminis]MCC9604429.1 hypothetical protein [Blastopirellula sediminis]MCC9632272.1 hypothetical protein [Blastopirellula sediminis]